MQWDMPNHENPVQFHGNQLQACPDLLLNFLTLHGLTLTMSGTPTSGRPWLTTKKQQLDAQPGLEHMQHWASTRMATHPHRVQYQAFASCTNVLRNRYAYRVIASSSFHISKRRSYRVSSAGERTSASNQSTKIMMMHAALLAKLRCGSWQVPHA